MKKILFSVSALILSSSAFAGVSTNYKFVALDNTEATNLCIVAAEQGLEGVRAIDPHALFDSSLRCNGRSLLSFAKKFGPKKEQDQKQVVYKVVAANENEASKVCALAAEKGLSALNLSASEADDILCNGRKLPEFAARFSSI